MISMVEGSVFQVLLIKGADGSFLSLGLKPIAPVSRLDTVKNQERRSTARLSGLGSRVDFYA